MPAAFGQADLRGYRVGWRLTSARKGDSGFELGPEPKSSRTIGWRSDQSQCS